MFLNCITNLRNVNINDMNERKLSHLPNTNKV